MRIRITFSKSGALRYIGHLDLHQVWERTIRRAGLPLEYTQGFHPGPKIQIASALPLGFIGREEMVDLWLKDYSSDALQEVFQQGILAKSAPPGLVIINVKEIPNQSPALQTQVIAAEYLVVISDPTSCEDLGKRVQDLLARPSILRERRGKVYDLRPLILRLEYIDLSLGMTLSARDGATGRPDEVLAELGLPMEMACIERIRLILKDEVESIPVLGG